MITQPMIYALQEKAFACTALTAIVGNNIAYERGPVGDTWPLVHFFEVSSMDGYQVDYNFCTVQFSCWALDKWDALALKEIIYNEFNRFSGKVTTSLGDVDINWTEMIDSGALPQADATLYGSYVRFKFRYRGANLGGL